MSSDAINFCQTGRGFVLICTQPFVISKNPYKSPFTKVASAPTNLKRLHIK